MIFVLSTLGGLDIRHARHKIMKQSEKELRELCGHVCRILSIIIEHPEPEPEPEPERESPPDGFKTLVEEFIE